MNDTEIAIAVSVRSWPDLLRRFLADHGGARVRLTAMSPTDLDGESFDVLLIDDVCSYLSPALVASVKLRDVAVLGVFDPSEYPDGKDRLLDCGVSDVVDARAHPDEFLELIARVRQLAPEESSSHMAAQNESSSGATVLVIGAGGGVGVTEVSAAIAGSIAKRARSCALIDLDLAAASVAQRFDLKPHPNLLTAIDILEENSGKPSMVPLGAVSVLPGAPEGSHLGSLRPRQLVALIDRISAAEQVVVVDAGAEGGQTGALVDDLVRGADLLVAVGVATPVGIGRLLRLVRQISRPADLLINRSPRDSFRRGEIVGEVAGSYAPRSLAFLPEDSAVTESAWSGKQVVRGRFVKSVDRWVGTYAVGIVG